MINKNALKLWPFLLIFLVVAIGFVSAGGIQTSVIVQSVPLETEWVADGAGVYRMDVRLDATTYDEPIVAFDWRVHFPDYITFVDGEFPEEDFFFGDLKLDLSSDPVFEVTDTSILGTVRLHVNEFDNAPVGGEGIIASYWFTVNQDANLGKHSFSFSLTNIVIYDPDLDLCPPFPFCDGIPEAIENLPFWIINPLCPADFNGDGNVGASDLLTLLAAWGPNPGHPADLDGNGIVGASDLLTLLVSWGPCPEGLNGGGYGSGEAQRISLEAENILKDFLGEEMSREVRDVLGIDEEESKYRTLYT